MNSINIVLTTTSPWYVAYPENESKELKGVSLTQKKSVFGQQVPCYLGNGLRGQFRRSIGQLIIDSLRGRGETIPANVFIGLQTGSASAQPDKSMNSVEELTRSAQHVYMGLFGGGARTLRSRYSVSDITPILHCTVETNEIVAPKGMVDEVLDSLHYTVKEDGKETQKIIEGWQLIEKRWFTKVDDFERGNVTFELLDAIENGTEAVSEYLSGNAENSKQRKAAKNAEGNEVVKKTSVANMLGFETIKTGVKMHFRVDFDSTVTEAQFGALLLALEAWVNRNYVGGWGRTNFGRFKVDAIRIDSDRFEIFESYTSEALYTEGKFTLANMADDIKSHVAACKSEIEAVERDEIVSYFTNLVKA
ncbi:TPA: type IV CRISPR-associated protein Csf2 [Vibrio parahaemolyticus]|uniref:type IV CRISPR-associated protein Csf2 n=1 Tax=Gammaproteobacteria TaxID=1236 RepID=UPI001868CCF3|nr:type IV CRISPR-associated protein Csf2 [Citrobacter freundii]EAX1870565.1 type IV CRISPR-associated protein Csf2 [Salmonella enterica]EGR4190779.1 type IV CRISPR-associated protein Csf2 [Vibrio cholerae]MDZ3971790.1 type IV CRISPR-associated protein Csf2 [Escherichia coli]HCJ7330933.1 type IV CRISPR-associated protein Csf2 [Enterobacter hormaechei subsp. xiangfangensis]HDE1521833.1 type IV CRISPR-associated protein Csf2 [Klebsiella pneumoniae]